MLEENNDKDFPLLDVVLGRRQLVQCFCEAFERFLQIYQVFPNEEGV